MKSVMSVIVMLAYITGLGQVRLPMNNSTDSSFRFSLTISTFNHAEWIVRGMTIYKITNTAIQVLKNAIGSKKDTIVYAENNPSPQAFFSIINNTRLDTLKDFYSNFCVLPTSGGEYIIDVETLSLKKHIRLHHYYLKQVDTLVSLINIMLSDKYRLRYLPKETEQDCKLWQ